MQYGPDLLVMATVYVGGRYGKDGMPIDCLAHNPQSDANVTEIHAKGSRKIFGPRICRKLAPRGRCRKKRADRGGGLISVPLGKSIARAEFDDRPRNPCHRP